MIILNYKMIGLERKTIAVTHPKKLLGRETTAASTDSALVSNKLRLLRAITAKQVDPVLGENEKEKEKA